MKGSIHIELMDVGDEQGMTIKLNLQEGDAFSCILVVNALANALGLSHMDRMMLSAMLNGIGHVPSKMMAISQDDMPDGISLDNVNMEELIKQMKEEK